MENDSRGERRCEISQDAPVEVFNYKITAVDDELPDVDLNCPCDKK